MPNPFTALKQQQQAPAGNPFTAMKQQAAQEPQGSAASRFTQGVISGVDPRPLLDAVMDPLGAIRGLYQAQVGEYDKAVEKYQQARETGDPSYYAEAGGHLLANILPILGPVASQIGQKIGSGDVAGGLGEATSIMAPTAAAKAAGSVAKPVAGALRKGAEKAYSQAFAPTRVRTKAQTQKVVPELLRRREMAPGRQAMIAKAKGRQDVALDLLEEAEAKIPEGAEIELKPVLDDLEKARQRNIGAEVEVEATGGTQIVDAQGNPVKRTQTQVIGNEAAVKNIERLQQQLMNLDDVSFESVRRIRRVWDKEVAEAGGYHGATLKEGAAINAKKEAANAIRRELGKEFPDIAKINAEYSLWKSVEDVLVETQKRTTGQAKPLGQTIAQAAGAGGGLAAGGGLMGAAGGAFILNGLKRFFQSPGYKMVSAVQKQRLADALASGNLNRIGRVTTGIIAANQNLGR